jgi:hypothetical protein
VLGFLDYNPSMLMQFDSVTDGLSFPTPRSWEMVSNILNYVSDDIDQVFPLISGCIGEAAAYELRTWSEVDSRIPDIEDIFEGKEMGVPIRPEILFALSSNIVNYAHSHHNDSELKNVVKYASQMPVEFRNRIFADLLQIRGIHKGLSKLLIYDDWFLRSGRDWEDYGVI